MKCKVLPKQGIKPRTPRPTFSTLDNERAVLCRMSNSDENQLPGNEWFLKQFNCNNLFIGHLLWQFQMYSLL